MCARDKEFKRSKETMDKRSVTFAIKLLLFKNRHCHLFLANIQISKKKTLYVSI